MNRGKAEVRAWESRWAVPAGIASILAVVLLIVSGPVNVSGDGQAEVLREVDAHGGAVLLSGLMQTLAFLLLALPLVYLFRAVQARSDRVRTQLIGLVVAAPLFLAASSALTIAATNEAADQFVAGEAKPTLSRQEAKKDCRSDLEGEKTQAACEDRRIEDDAASNAVGETSLAPVVSGLGLAGGFGFAIALLYSALWAMRTGLLTRFWGSLGMVAGVAFLLGPLFLVTLVFFVYLGLLALGILPGGRPPAWEAGEAIPWPTPGEKAAAELEPDPDHRGQAE